MWIWLPKILLPTLPENKLDKDAETLVQVEMYFKFEETYSFAPTMAKSHSPRSLNYPSGTFGLHLRSAGSGWGLWHVLQRRSGLKLHNAHSMHVTVKKGLCKILLVMNHHPWGVSLSNLHL